LLTFQNLLSSLLMALALLGASPSSRLFRRFTRFPTRAFHAQGKALSFLQEVVAGRASLADSDRDRWKWSVRIVQPKPLTESLLLKAIAAAKEKKPNPYIANADAGLRPRG
jgi:hypothetical protein